MYENYNSRKPENIAVILGDHDLDKEDKTYHVIANVTRIILHPCFDSISYDNDIALLELSKTITFQKHIQPVCIPSYGLNYFIFLRKSIVNSFGLF